MSNGSFAFRRYRSVFLSDIHLGYKDCKADQLLQFLNTCRCDTLYLLGDIVDLWSIQRRHFWPEEHHQVIARILQLAEQGTKVIYIPGNHDAAVRSLLPLVINQIECCDESVHHGIDGKRYLLIHGDLFDGLVACPRLLAWIGDKLYDALLFLNRWYNRIRAIFGKPYWSLAKFIKSRVGGAQAYILRYQSAALEYAKKRGFSGIFCGHIHQPALLEESTGCYFNCGDWIENCSYICEDFHGKFSLQYWPATDKETLISLDSESALDASSEQNDQKAA